MPNGVFQRSATEVVLFTDKFNNPTEKYPTHGKKSGSPTDFEETVKHAGLEKG